MKKLLLYKNYTIFWWVTFVSKMHWYMLQCYCSLSDPFSMCRLDLIYFWGWFVGFCCTSSIFYLSTFLPTIFISRLVCPAPGPPLLILRHGSDVTPSSADTTEATNEEWRSKQSLPSWKSWIKVKDIHKNKKGTKYCFPRICSYNCRCAMSKWQ